MTGEGEAEQVLRFFGGRMIGDFTELFLLVVASVTGWRRKRRVWDDPGQCGFR